MVHCVSREDACERPRIGGWRWRQVLGLWRMQCTRHRDQRARVQWRERLESGHSVSRGCLAWLLLNLCGTQGGASA
jgi:hypothetical protein